MIKAEETSTSSAFLCGHRNFAEIVVLGRRAWNATDENERCGIVRRAWDVIIVLGFRVPDTKGLRSLVYIAFPSILLASGIDAWNMPLRSLSGRSVGRFSYALSYTLMDWTTILITLLTLLISNGGLVTLVTLRERKTAAFLDNVSKLIDQWQEVAEERKNRALELKSDLDKKDDKIDRLYAELSKLRNELDHTRTSEAVSRMLRCEDTGCIRRKPPFGSEKYNEYDKRNKK